MDCGKVKNCSVVRRIKISKVIFGKLGRHVIRTKEDKDNPSCYQCSVQKPASLMVWGCMVLTAIWILSWRSTRFCKRKLMIFEIRMDKESSRGIGMRLLAPSLNNRNLIFFGSPVPALALAKVAVGKLSLGKNTAVRRSCPSPPSLWIRQPDKRVCASAGKVAAGPDGCLLELDYFPCCKVLCLWCMCFCVLRCFSCSHTVLPKEHSLGVIFFLLTFLMLCCIFL